MKPGLISQSPPHSSTGNSISNRVKAWWPLIGGPLLVLGIVVLVETFSFSGYRIPNPPSLLLLAVVYSAFIGGYWPGFISTGLAWLYIAWFFSLPGQPFDYSDENLLRVLVWGLSMPFMAWMVGILKHRMVTLEQYRDVEETLRKSEEELRLFVRDTPASIAMFDKNMRYIAASKRWYEDYRLEHDSIIGLSHYEVFPDIPERWKKIHQRCLKGAVEQCDEDLFSREDGTTDWVRWEVRPWHDSKGQIGGIIILTEDITERKEAVQSLYNLAEGFSVTSGKEFFRSLTKHIGDTLDMDYVVVGELLYGRNDMIHSVEVYHRGEYLDPLEYSLKGTPCQQVIGKGVTGYASGILQAFPDFSLLTTLNIEGYVGSPLFNSQDQPLGLIAVLNHKPISNVNRIETLLQIFAVRAAAELERKQMEAALIKSEEKYRSIIDTTSEWIWEIDLEGHHTYSNKTIESILGYSVDEFMKKDIYQLMHEKERDNVRQFLAECIREKKGWRERTIRWQHKDGTYRYLESNAVPVFDNHGVVTGFRGSDRDITGRKQAEVVLHQTHRTLSVLSECNQAMLHAGNEMQLLSDICRIIVETGNYRMAWVGYAEQDENKSVRPVARWGYEQGYIESLNITWADEEYGHGPAGNAIRTGQSYVARNIQTEPDFAPWRKAALERGYASSVGIPLMKDDRAFGALMIYAPEPEAFNTEEMQLLEKLAGNLAYGVIALRTEKALQRNEEHLRFLYEENPSMYFTVAPDGTILSVNEFGASELGYAVKELLGKPVLNIFPESQRETVQKHLSECLKNFGQLHEWEIQKVRKNGKELWVRETARAVGTPEGKTAVLIVCRDVSKRRQVEEKLKKSQEQLRNLAVHLQAVREEERSGIAREIHDVLAQELTRLKLDIIWAHKRLNKSVNEPIRDALFKKVRDMADHVDMVISTVQKIATELRPVVLDSVGLCAAIEWQVEDFERRTNISCHVSVLTEETAINDEQATATFRILQESLTNVIRHAGANQLRVSLIQEDEELVLQIHDNGCGIAQEKLDDLHSIGLMGMRERALALGGKVQITGTPGSGTTVTAHIPLVYQA